MDPDTRQQPPPDGVEEEGMESLPASEPPARNNPGPARPRTQEATPRAPSGSGALDERTTGEHPQGTRATGNPEVTQPREPTAGGQSTAAGQPGAQPAPRGSSIQSTQTAGEADAPPADEEENSDRSIHRLLIGTIVLLIVAFLLWIMLS